jgi:DNA-binding LacI/PurR family transcriptional regulator
MTRLNDLDRTRFAPKYVELADKLVRHIAQNRLRPGDRLGTEVELAQANGVSRVTVRQALVILEEEGYISRRKARGTFVKRAVEPGAWLGNGRSTVVVVCASEQADHADEDVGFAELLRAMERRLTAEGCAIQILSVGADKAADRERLKELAGRDEITAFCAIGPCLVPYARVVEKTPVLQCGGFRSGGFPFVGPDLHAVGRDCIEHLLTRGHREVAMLCGSWVTPTAFRLFAEGFREGFERAGLPFPRRLLFQAYPGESLEQLAQDVLAGEPRPTAVFAENWVVCKAILAAAAKSNLQIPDDLSIIGYGQNVLRLVAPVGLTVYRPNTEALGEHGALLLKDAMGGVPLSEEPLRIAGRIIEGESVRTNAQKG